MISYINIPSIFVYSPCEIRLSQLKNGSYDAHQLLDTVEINESDHGWLVVKITNAVRQWQMDYHTNQGLHMEIVKKGTKEQIIPARIGFNTIRTAEPEKQSFMVGYFKRFHDSVMGSYRSSRVKRASKRNKRRRNRDRKKQYSELSDFSFADNTFVYGRDFYGGPHRNRPCQRRILRVDFRDLGTKSRSYFDYKSLF